MVRGPEGIEQYRQRRRVANRQFGTEGLECFHDSHQALACVKVMDSAMRNGMSTDDYITGVMIDSVIPSMVETDPAKRPAAQKLWQQAEQRLREAWKYAPLPETDRAADLSSIAGLQLRGQTELHMPLRNQRTAQKSLSLSLDPRRPRTHFDPHTAERRAATMDDVSVQNHSGSRRSPGTYLDQVTTARHPESIAEVKEDPDYMAAPASAIISNRLESQLPRPLERMRTATFGERPSSNQFAEPRWSQSIRHHAGPRQQGETSRTATIDAATSSHAYPQARFPVAAGRSLSTSSAHNSGKKSKPVVPYLSFAAVYAWMIQKQSGTRESRGAELSSEQDLKGKLQNRDHVSSARICIPVTYSTDTSKSSSSSTTRLLCTHAEMI